MSSSEELPLDIGLTNLGAASTGRAHGDGSKRSAPRRHLPIWAIVALALAAGWILGAVVGRGESTSDRAGNVTPTAEPAPSAEPKPETEADPAAVPDAAIGPAAFETGHPAVVLVQAPLRGVAIAADISVVDRGTATQIEVDRLISGATTGEIGENKKRMLVVGDMVVFMALDAVMAFDAVERTEPTELAQAIYLLPGSDPGHVWAVGSGSSTVQDLDVGQRRPGAIYDLTTVGVPLASFQGGLVIAPADSQMGRFAVWNPLRGVERIDVDERAEFVDAGGNLLVLWTPDGLATYNTVTGAFQRSDRQVAPSQRHQAIASPDGSLLALVERQSVAQLPIVAIVDTHTGAIIDEFRTAFAWQLHWVSNNELLFVNPLPDGIDVRVQDITTQTSESVIELENANVWVTTLTGH